MVSDTTRPTRKDEAARWFAAERAGAMLLEQRQEFDAWRADPRNQAALDAMRELWDDLSVLKGKAPEPRRAARWKRAPIAAAVAMVIVSGSIAAMVFRADPTVSITTAIGQQETQSLPDGSLVAVNVQSSVSYPANGFDRRVTLKGGEAAFTVKPDAAKPFIVHAGDIEIWAIGTSFNVRRRDDALQVAVSEGVVQICRISGGGPADVLATLSAGQLLLLPHDSVTLTPAPRSVPPDQVSEWRMRVVTYEDASVAEVVADINRYFERKLRVESDELMKRRVTVRLRVDDRERAIETLASLLDARVRMGVDADDLEQKE